MYVSGRVSLTRLIIIHHMHSHNDLRNGSGSRRKAWESKGACFFSVHEQREESPVLVLTKGYYHGDEVVLVNEGSCTWRIHEEIKVA